MWAFMYLNIIWFDIYAFFEVIYSPNEYGYHDNTLDFQLFIFQQQVWKIMEKLSSTTFL